MSNRIRIQLNGIDELRKFVHAVSTFEADVNIIKGRNVFDAKSLLGVIDIAPDAATTYVEILTDNQEQIEKFNVAMETFKA
jgi:phosphotransferase system HPr-like phosphotransfer protein